MPYPDIKEPDLSLEKFAIGSIFWVPEAIVTPVLVAWAVVYFGLEIKPFWLSILVTVMIFFAIACFIFYFYATAIERKAEARRKRFTSNKK